MTPVPSHRQNSITIGNFDGLHLGHAQLIRAARQAVGAGGRVIVMAFDPHPATILRPPKAPAPLSTFAQKRDWALAAGADEVVHLHPTIELLGLEPAQFIAKVVAQHQPAVIVEGPDFRFGRARAGSIDTLRELEAAHGYRTVVADAVEAMLNDQTVVRVSSSLIRWLVARGRMRDAAALLGRPYELRGAVACGDKRGRTIGMPTINLDCGPLLLPADGIYTGIAQIEDGSQYPAAISVGTKPTFGDHPRICEAHLLGYDGPLDHYGWPVRLEIHNWLRDQLAFSSVEQLKRQLQRDLRSIHAGPAERSEKGPDGCAARSRPTGVRSAS